jgi:hypothetical protein
LQPEDMAIIVIIATIPYTTEMGFLLRRL